MAHFKFIDLSDESMESDITGASDLMQQNDVEMKNYTMINNSKSKGRDPSTRPKMSQNFEIFEFRKIKVVFENILLKIMELKI